jgi:hypothetical protein
LRDATKSIHFSATWSLSHAWSKLKLWPSFHLSFHLSSLWWISFLSIIFAKLWCICLTTQVFLRYLVSLGPTWAHPQTPHLLHLLQHQCRIDLIYFSFHSWLVSWEMPQGQSTWEFGEAWAMHEPSWSSIPHFGSECIQMLPYLGNNTKTAHCLPLIPSYVLVYLL